MGIHHETSAGQTSTHAPAVRTIPVIVVPGIMGSRLMEPSSGALVYNPTGHLAALQMARCLTQAAGASSSQERAAWTRAMDAFSRSPGPNVCDTARLADVDNPLVPDMTNLGGYPPDLAARAAGIHGFYGLMPENYDELCFGMKEQLPDRFFDLGKTFRVRVYGAGYDWRQSSARSAVTLGQVVTLAMRECDNEPVILIAHSMGGIVARYYCKFNEANVRGLFLIASPSLGAAKPYVWLKRGIANTDAIMDLVIRVPVFGLDQAGSQSFIRKLPGIYQLMPNRVYASSPGMSHWLTYSPEHTGYPHVSSAPAAQLAPGRAVRGCHFPRQLYKDLFTGLTDRAEDRAVHEKNVNEACRVHEALTMDVDGHARAYMHPVTYAYYSDGDPTISTVELPDEDGVYQVNAGLVEYVPFHGESQVTWQTHGGDTSVPQCSARPEPYQLHPAFQNYRNYGTPAHTELPNHAGLIQNLVSDIAGLDYDSPTA